MTHSAEKDAPRSSIQERWNPCPVHASQNQPCRECRLAVGRIPAEQLEWDREEVAHAALAYQAGLDAGLNAGYQMGQVMGNARVLPPGVSA